MLLDHWGTSIVQRNIENAEKLKEEIESVIKDDNDSSTERKYLILCARHYFLQKSDFQAKTIIEKIRNFSDEISTFYYYFYNGVYAYNAKKYDEALESYRTAEGYLEQLEIVEQAEYHYRAAAVYYQIQETLISLTHTKQALHLFQTDMNFKLRQSDCRMLLALNYIDMKQFLLAEEEFHAARDIAQKAGHKGLLAKINHNLGFMYAEQNLSEAAIRYLSDVMESKDHDNTINTLQTMFLLTREHFKLDRMEKAKQWLNKGLILAEELENEEYMKKFKLLHSIHVGGPDFEKTFQEGISYFHREKLWLDVAEYAQILARFYLQSHEYKKATDYYEMTIEAKNKIKKMEALI